MQRLDNQIAELIDLQQREVSRMIHTAELAYSMLSCTGVRITTTVSTDSDTYNGKVARL